MISEFVLENFGPFKDRTVLDFRATKLKDREDTLIPTSCGKAIVSSIAIFGANATGKSCILQALGSLVDLMRYPRKTDNPLPYNPFRLSPETKSAPTSMEIRLYIQGVPYDYRLSYNRLEILSESLYYSPNGRRTKVFTRENGEYSCSKDSKVNLTNLTKMIGTNSTFLSVAARFNHDICREVVDASSSVVVLSGDEIKLLGRTIFEMEHDADFKKLVLDAMVAADFSIDDIRGAISEASVTKLDGALPKENIRSIVASESSSVDRVSMNIRHKVGTDGVSDVDRTFPYLIESGGTVRMISIIGLVIRALSIGGTIAIDDFGAYLDEDICRWIVSMFSGDRNKAGAQLIFNTHNQLLMDTENIFRRDQIYIVSKDRTTQASELYSLSDFNLRRSYDPRKGFSLGKFGGRPFILSEYLLVSNTRNRCENGALENYQNDARSPRNIHKHFPVNKSISCDISCENA